MINMREGVVNILHGYLTGTGALVEIKAICVLFPQFPISDAHMSPSPLYSWD